jgi:hypothetical protein
VSFDPDPAFAFHGRDLPRKGHWRAVKQGSEMGGYLRLFSLKSRDFGIFWHDGGFNIKQVAKNDVVSFNGLIISTPYFSR